MKVVAEIIVAIILIASGGYLAPKAVESFKNETLMKVDKGLPSLQDFTCKMTSKNIKTD